MEHNRKYGSHIIDGELNTRIDDKALKQLMSIFLARLPSLQPPAETGKIIIKRKEEDLVRIQSVPTYC